MTSILPAPAPAPGSSRVGPMQQRINQNVETLIGFRRTTKRALARELEVDPAGITARLKGETPWRTVDIEAAARHLHVQWWWLVLPLPELLAKCTAGDLNPEPADSVQAAVARAALVSERVVTSASPRGRGGRLPLVRQWGSAAATSPRAA